MYVGLDRALASLVRVRERVIRGGHNVPAEAVLRRFGKSLANLQIAIGLADRSFILDNTKSRHRLIVTIDGDRTRQIVRNLPKWATVAVPGLSAPQDR